MTIAQYILAIIFPPASVFLATGLSTAFLLNIALTVLGLVPGIVHALWILTKQSESIELES